VTADPLDLGHGVTAVFVSWRRFEQAGVIETHNCVDGERKSGGIMFDLPGMREAFPGRPLWALVSLEPLTITPSVLCSECGHHGYIKNGRWEPC